MVGESRERFLIYVGIIVLAIVVMSFTAYYVYFQTEKSSTATSTVISKDVHNSQLTLTAEESKAREAQVESLNAQNKQQTLTPEQAQEKQDALNSMYNN